MPIKQVKISLNKFILEKCLVDYVSFFFKGKNQSLDYKIAFRLNTNLVKNNPDLNKYLVNTTLIKFPTTILFFNYKSLFFLSKSFLEGEKNFPLVKEFFLVLKDFYRTRLFAVLNPIYITTSYFCTNGFKLIKY